MQELVTLRRVEPVAAGMNPGSGQVSEAQPITRYQLWDGGCWEQRIPQHQFWLSQIVLGFFFLRILC